MDHRGTCISDSDNPCIRGDIYRDMDTNFEKINQFEKCQKMNIIFRIYAQKEGK